MSDEIIKKLQGFENSIEFAMGLDESDPLKNFQYEFLTPEFDGRDQIYFLGNSLGLQSKNTKGEIEKILDQWNKLGVEGFFIGDEPWLDYHSLLTTSLSRIVGAMPHEITVMNQLTVNLHLMMVSFYRPMGKRRKILCEAKAFPSDQYMFETHLRHHNLDVNDVVIEVEPRPGEHGIRHEDILAAIEKNKNELALVLFSGVNYYTGQVFDIRSITDAAHRIGAIAGFDLAHAVGNVSMHLHEWDVDFACWCSYKYLNSGPGGVGGVYIHERYHNDNSIQRFAGWWGYDSQARFKMEKGFRPARTAEGWQLSTPSLLLFACHKASLEMFDKAGWHILQTKKKKLNDYLWYVLDEAISDSKEKIVELITPRPNGFNSFDNQGCQVSLLMYNRGKEIFDEIARKGIMADWREPNVIRVAPVPLYNTYLQVWKFGNALRDAL